MDEFPISAESLSNLLKDRDTNGNDQLKEKFGGAKGLVKSLQTSVESGISVESGLYEERQKKYGVNQLPVKKPKLFILFFFEALKDRTLIILSVSAIISIILGLFVPSHKDKTGWIEGAAILVAVLIVSLVTSLNDWSKDRQFRKLSLEASNKRTKVLRDGKQAEISIFDVVVGDIVLLETGDYIPADLIYLSGQVSVDESSMTGEPEAIQKGEEDPFLLGGCMVTEGYACKGLCIAVGIHSQWGQVKASLEKEDSQTPLQEKLEKLAGKIGKVGLAAALLTLAVLIIEWAIVTFGIKHKSWVWQDLGSIVDFVITAVAIIAIAIPEGLPLAVTLSLAYSMVRMIKDQNLVRHLSACETMGSATCICSDKTGTLTQNRMTVVNCWMSGTTYDISNLSQIKKNHSVDLLTEGICVNSTAYLVDNDQPDHEPKVVGMKTEGALLLLAKKLGIDYQEIRKSRNIVKVFPFSPRNKNMITILEKSNEMILHCKGAGEVVLKMCTKMIDDRGKIEEISETRSKELNKVIEGWASQGFRTLTISFREIPVGTKLEEVENLSRDMILIAIIGIEDPLREEVPNSVKTCQRAGITVRMVTGDNILTAKNIAKRCGILSDDGIAIEGPDFRRLSQSELDDIIPKLQVVARCTPQDKLILGIFLTLTKTYLTVKRLRELGEVVACTGDGSNDAPILREADVGFAMGISGTEIAKDASDIVLLDDNFSSIEKAVLWGRNVLESIKKFIQFQMTVNISALIIAFVGAASSGSSPLTAVQMLWVNLLMDSFAALALATQRPTNDLLDRPPSGRDSPLITRRMWRNMIGQAILQLAILFFTFYGSHLIPNLGIPSELDSRRKRTLVFNTFVFCQLFNEINCRKINDEMNVLSGILGNVGFLGIMSVTLVAQIIFVEFGKSFLQTLPLNGKQWAYSILLGSLAIPFGMLLKKIPVNDKVTSSKEQKYNEPQKKTVVEEIDMDESKTPFLKGGLERKMEV